ncbi:site-2 protease family protein [Oscillatoria sp. FACHB-1407]|uniref:site-2 protease family protein n=1 Tax=Oscillatoria sp. FACHB-1407 TaxID=2692847 RepID=UPI001682D134|nr:site-2 protease family protein [Oscillatoria sp. FACHB-1407]MBD2461614.1 site-2 protease family protein [Oscillatoria sp. FACHB-1407]
MIFWLLLLGIFTYLIVQRSVANITRTPVWILWLVMMTPAFVWTGWILLNGESAPIPPVLVLVPFILCPVLYWLLIQWGRPAKPASAEAQPATAEAAITPSVEKRPTLRPIDKQEESMLQNCFPWSVYYLQNIEYRPQALICRGQLRTSPEVAYETIRENVEGHFGNRFLVVFQEGLNGKPFFALVPNPQLQTVNNQSGSETVSRPGLAIGLLIVTILTSTLAGALFSGVPDDGSARLTLPLFLTGLPYAIALMAVLGTHELAHYLAARFYKIRATLPYFIPVPPTNFFPFGTFGAFIQMRSPVPNRKALFDIGIAGPLAGFFIAVPVLLWGLAHSTTVPLSDESGIFNFDSLRPSLLLPALLSKLALGNALTATDAIQLHPVAIAGYLGLIVTAINLTPVGQLDGGHIVHAMFGQRVGAAIGQVARLLVLALSLVQQEFLLWAILLFFIPVVDEPALNDVSELDNKRDLWGLFALSLLVMIILPAPQVVTRILF